MQLAFFALCYIMQVDPLYITSLSLNFLTCQKETMMLPTRGLNDSGEVLARCPVCDTHLIAVNYKHFAITRHTMLPSMRLAKANSPCLIWQLSSPRNALHKLTDF